MGGGAPPRGGGDAKLYFIMEYCSGGSLAAALKARHLFCPPGTQRLATGSGGEATGDTLALFLTAKEVRRQWQCVTLQRYAMY